MKENSEKQYQAGLGQDDSGKPGWARGIRSYGGKVADLSYKIFVIPPELYKSGQDLRKVILGLDSRFTNQPRFVSENSFPQNTKGKTILLGVVHLEHSGQVLNYVEEVKDGKKEEEARNEFSRRIEEDITRYLGKQASKKEVK